MKKKKEKGSLKQHDKQWKRDSKTPRKRRNWNVHGNNFFFYEWDLCYTHSQRTATTPGTSCPTLFKWCVGSLTSHIERINMEGICETRLAVYSPYLHILYTHTHTHTHIHDHSLTGLFRASSAQRDRPNACEGTPGRCKRSWKISEQSNQVRCFWLG